MDGGRYRSCQIGAGGVIRYSDGSWAHGFSAYKGSGSVLEAEIWGLLLGFKMAASNQCV